VETGNSSKNELKEEFIHRLERLIQASPPARKDRFLPFLIVLAGKTGDPRYAESLNIVRYFLQNAMLFTKQDEDFYRILKSVVQDEQGKPCRWENAIQDCLKVVYDLR
jgi:hypothetical protein